MQTGRFEAGDLLERGAEVQALLRMVERSAAAGGSMAVIQAHAGLGKTRLLDEVARVAPSTMILRAAGAELENSYAYGLLRDLFSRPAGMALSTWRKALEGNPLAASILGTLPNGLPPVADAASAVRAVYEFCADLTVDQSMLLLLDDIQWADEASVRCLAYLARRLEDLPVALVVAVGPPPVAIGRIALPDLLGSAEKTIPLAPLSRAGAARLVETALGSSDPAFQGACHEASGGNPFLLRELLGEVHRLGLPPSAETAQMVGGINLERVRHAVLSRINAMGPAAVAMAQGFAVLAVASSARDAAALMSLGTDESLAAIDQLQAAGILAGGGPWGFEQPLVRAAVYGDIGLARRARLHGLVARLLSEAGRPYAAVAVHLMRSNPNGDPWVVEQLTRAAAEALATGAPDAAVRLLDRALVEPPGRDRHHSVVLLLAEANMAVDPGRAVQLFERALTDATTIEDRFRCAVRLAAALELNSDFTGAVSVLDSVLATIPESNAELRLRLEVESLGREYFDPAGTAAFNQRLARLGSSIDEGTEAGRIGRIYQAVRAVSEGTAAEVVALTDLGWADGRLSVENSAGANVLNWAPYLYTWADRPELGRALLERGVGVAREAGNVPMLAGATFMLAWVQLRMGDLLEAESNAMSAWRMVADLGGSLVFTGPAASILVAVLVARGQLAEAETFLHQNGLQESVPDVLAAAYLPETRAELKLLQGDPAGALSELEWTRSKFEREGRGSPVVSRWMHLLPVALYMVGRPAEALEVAAEGLRMSRAFGAPTAIGEQLLALGLVTDGDDRLPLLEAAAEVLRGAPSPVRYANALIELGATLRRDNRRAAARPLLEAALDTAHRHGATHLAARGREELLALGARPRRPSISGVESLTASELRVANLAANGRNNPDIARALFVSRKTVEKHLGNVFDKLAVTGRGELRAALTNHAQAGLGADRKE